MERMRVVQVFAVAATVIFLLGMVSPTLEQSREIVQRAKCASNLKQLGTAWQAYLGDYHYYVPGYGGVVQFGWGKGVGWMDKLFPYIRPDAVGKGPAYLDSADATSTEAFRCPSLPRSQYGMKYLCSYFLNVRLYLDGGGGRANMRKLKFPWKVIVNYDRNKWTGSPDDADATDEWGNSPTAFSDAYGPGALWYYHSGGPDFSGPHDRGYNILFADWHVAWYGEWVSEMMTRHAEYLQENDQPPKDPK